MSRVVRTSVSLAGLSLTAPSGEALDLGSLSGVHVMVLMRHRH